MTEGLEHKVALVTGASSGIGRATAISLARAGVKVAVSARRTDRLTELVRQIEAEGRAAVALPGDVTDETVAAQTVELTVERLGGLDILVNSVGIIQAGNMQDPDLAEWRRVMEVNFFSMVQTNKAALKPMLAQGSGDIVNISSVSGRRTARLFGAYSPSKFAMTSYSESLRQEVGGAGIRICVVEPGATESEVAHGITDPKWREMMQNHVTREGAMKAQDIADAVMFALMLPRRANVSQILVRPTIDVAASF